MNATWKKGAFGMVTDKLSVIVGHLNKFSEVQIEDIKTKVDHIKHLQEQMKLAKASDDLPQEERVGRIVE